jgi:hypothetical protein
MYHVMNRGDHREPIFVDHNDRNRFLASLGEVCAKTQWQIHAFCLMSNRPIIFIRFWKPGNPAAEPGGWNEVVSGPTLPASIGGTNYSAIYSADGSKH